MWYPAVSLQQLPPSGYCVVNLNGIQIAIYQLEDGLYAFEDKCTHNPCPLSGGPVEDDQITCMMHGARFCIKTGAALAAPAFHSLRTFSTRVINGVIEVQVDD